MGRLEGAAQGEGEPAQSGMEVEDATEHPSASVEAHELPTGSGVEGHG
jgi:hypothetical protein